MKISDLLTQLAKALDKYGDIDVCGASIDSSTDLFSSKDGGSIAFRVLQIDDLALPGESFDDQEERKVIETFGVIFYDL